MNQGGDMCCKRERARDVIFPALLSQAPFVRAVRPPAGRCTGQTPSCAPWLASGWTLWQLGGLSLPRRGNPLVTLVSLRRF